jgi:hypothetical protein
LWRWQWNVRMWWQFNDHDGNGEWGLKRRLPHRLTLTFHNLNVITL